MYTDEDLNLAVEKGIFTDSSVNAFRLLLASQKNTSAVDEENFKLIGGFNDIFIVIACALLLFSSLWVLKSFNESLGLLIFATLSWVLAEFFVLKRKMALPAIMLLLSFIGGVFTFSTSLFSTTSEITLIVAATLSAIAAYFHWQRFRVPITIAVGTAAALGILVSTVAAIVPDATGWLQLMFFISGVAAFSLAMVWDASDTERVTHKSDVAFWLHLLSAPLIIHPIFSSLGILAGDESLASLATVIMLYLVMTSISIAVDRRAFMVSSLAYVVYALSSIIETFGGVGYSFALTGVFMGGALLILSAYWHNVRANLVAKLPEAVQQHLPRIKELVQ
ncbi:MAG: hypothetical protein P1P93_04255 [Gammaproteobacteria bacterium]|nr:hypothetical protein [Gammaproteobacteria bacterium]